MCTQGVDKKRIDGILENARKDAVYFDPATATEADIRQAFDDSRKETKMVSKKRLKAVENHYPKNQAQPSEEETQVRAELQARREKIEREKACQSLVEKILAEHNCGVSASFKLGEQIIPTQQLVNLPVMVMIASL